MDRKVLRIDVFSQVEYCGGYSGEDPPLPIPNREVKLTIADGTDPPVGRVGSRRSSGARTSIMTPGLLRFHYVRTSRMAADVQGVLLGVAPCTENLHPKGPKGRLGVQGMRREITPCTDCPSRPRRTTPKNPLFWLAMSYKMLTVSVIGDTLCSKKDKGKLLTG